MDDVIKFQCPSATEFVTLRELANISTRDINGSAIGLKNSNVMVTIRKGDLLIAMGRIVGDGATTFVICDVVVHPDHQKRGLGKVIMDHLMDWLKENASPNSYVSLIASDYAVDFYKPFGFTETAPTLIGMHQFLKKG